MPSISSWRERSISSENKQIKGFGRWKMEEEDEEEEEEEEEENF